MSRGAFIVFEGGDRCGKSSQCSMLVESLKKQGTPVEFLHFPDRSTPTGKLIDDYLKRSSDLDDHVIHLLFSANRWEAEESIRKKLQSGITLVVDRYSYSGVAFSAAKKVPNLDLHWCKQPERGLPKPDVVIFLNLPPGEASLRDSFGSERYEDVAFQNEVLNNFIQLKSSNWQEFDASKSKEDLHLEIKSAVEKALSEVKPHIDTIWTDNESLPS